MVLVSTIGFLSMPDIVVWLKNTSDITLLVKFRMLSFVQGQTMNQCHFWQHRSIFIIFGDNHRVFGHARHIVMGSECTIDTVLLGFSFKWPPFV